MLTSPKISGKLEQILPHYRSLRFQKISDVAMQVYETKEMLRGEPMNGNWRQIHGGDRWGGNWVSGWFRGEVVVPDALAGKRLFLQAKTGGIEALLLVNGEHRGTFNDQHPFVEMTASAVAGSHHIAIESYSGHNFPGAQPNEVPIVVPAEGRTFDSVTLQVEREDVSAFVYDLDVLMNLARVLEPNSLRRATILRELENVWRSIPAFPAESPELEWRASLLLAREIMAPLLKLENGPTTPEIALVAHSHIDTAWLWPIAETRRKTGRTFSSMVNLMERYPEVIFLQSAPCHAEMAKEDYPQVFERMKKLVAEGRWEPNGGAWIEPDCNLTGGEALVRQFLVGINWTREHYGYSSDCLWQPDVFGYSAALPQILLGFNLPYFLTTKMAWNDTTRFPYDTFTWRGIDGSAVLTHLNSLPQFINAHNVVEMWTWAQHKDSENARLGSYGWGDGGGGPTMEDMEIIRRLSNLEGAPKTHYTTVTKFMNTLAESEREWPEWVGELYLELHRGTLTSIAGIKRGNRRCEFAIRNAEIAWSIASSKGNVYPAEKFLAVWKRLLINQFHDILPGTSIARVNDEAMADFAAIESECKALTQAAFDGTSSTSDEVISIFNSLSWDRTSDIVLPIGMEFQSLSNNDSPCQRVEALNGEAILVISGVTIPALANTEIRLSRNEAKHSSAFKVSDDEIETPHGVIRFDGEGRIVSYRLNRCSREVVKPSGFLNAFYSGEDVPLGWDNWDIDADQQLRMAPEIRLLNRSIVCDGPLQLRISQRYRIGKSSDLHQHIILHANSPRITFETKVDWREKHTLLKVGFDLDILNELARHEIQFGHVERPAHRNLLQDRARFEVCAHKWTDLSDNGFGISILNDCKYGVSVIGGSVQLSLLKSGTHPDERGDNGTHFFTYEILPHEGPFSVPAVVRPAYELNCAPFVVPATGSHASFISVDSETIIIEAIKRSEDNRGLIVRLYEAGRKQVDVTLSFSFSASEVWQTNMLEEKQVLLDLRDGKISLRMKPFEIKTLFIEL